MRYFYYVKHGGRWWPQASTDNPPEKIEKFQRLSPVIHNLTEEHLHLTLDDLMKIFPEPSQ